MKIGIATCLTLPEPDADEEITFNAFRDRGHEVTMLPWETSHDGLSGYDGIVIRSTWNYPDNAEAFANWIRLVDAQTKLLNPAEIMLANMNKRYLEELSQRGVPVIPSQWIFPSEAEKLKDMLNRKSVIKPVVGVGSMDARSFEPHQVEDAIEWLSDFEASREFMVQGYVASVDTVGEQSIIMIGGEPSHRIHKMPRFDDGVESVKGPFEVTDEFLPLARKAIQPIQDRILYARVDMMCDEKGKWVVSELELIEPSLFFRQQPEALEKFVRTTERLLT